jgi:hypothetical protein
MEKVPIIMRYGPNYLECNFVSFLIYRNIDFGEKTIFNNFFGVLDFLQIQKYI